ncbi:MAG: flippase, partial [Ignavibacteria bacterium]|nr:flippase [Ignavibacteria bacterium]
LKEKLKPYRTLVSNFTSLSVLQAANYLFPLIILPYVVRVLGPGKYGLINFAVAFIAYFNLISEYGFNLSGTKAISLVRDSKKELSRTFSVILFIKIVLSVFSFVILLVIVYSIPFFNNNWEIYLLSFGMVIGWILFPGWFYQGIEKMKYITIIQVIVRSIITVLIFILIKQESDYLLLVILHSIAQILIGIAGLIVVRVKFHVKFCIPAFIDVKNQFKSGWNIFQSMIAINFYTTSNTFILGLFASETVVGYYAAADKIRIAFQGILSVLSQSVFPYVNNLYQESYQKFKSFIRLLLKIETSIGFILSLVMFIFSYQIADFLLGEKFIVSGEILRIISVIPLIVSISNVFGIQTILSMGYDKVFNKIISSAAIIHLILLLVLVPKYFAVGTAYAVVLTEFIVLLFTFFFVYKRKLV